MLLAGCLNFCKTGVNWFVLITRSLVKWFCSSAFQQGSVLGPSIFIEYEEDVSDIFQHQGVHHHLFADDMQGDYGGRPSDAATELHRHRQRLVCHKVTSAQCRQDRATLVWLCFTVSSFHHPPSERSITIDGSVIATVSVVHDLGVFFDEELSMQDHVSRLAQTCSFHLIQRKSNALLR